MKTVKIGRSFTGYPNKKRREFAEGETPDLADTYADLIIGKGLASEVKATAKSIEGDGTGKALPLLSDKERVADPIEPDPETAKAD